VNYERRERIRRAAILVASLEERLAEQMLAALPRLEAAKILAEVDQLGEVDVEEQQDVLDEFRRAGRQASAADNAVEFTYSASQVAASLSSVAHEAANMSSTGGLAAADNENNASEAILMAELLMQEHPQIAAAALSRLDHEQGAAVFAALPGTLQGEVVDRLANLQPADEDAVQDLQAQLEQRVQSHRERRQRAVAGADLARRILSKTPPSQQAALLARLSPTDVAVSHRSSSMGGNVHDASQQAHQLTSAMQRVPVPEGTTFEAWAEEPQRGAESASFPGAELDVEDCSRELEQLADHELLDALRVADEQTVQRALAVSSENFLKRVAGKLPRRQAARLRKAVRAIGPARLVELRAAQNDLLRIARQRSKELAA